MADMPEKKAWVTYAEWGKTYGDIMHLRVFGQHTIILNSIEVVKDLIEKRSHIYSDRPSVPMIDLMEWDFNAGHKPYNSVWKVHRRLFDQTFKPSASVKYRPIQTRKINDLLYGLLTSPEDFGNHCRTHHHVCCLRIRYHTQGDYFVTLAEAAILKLSEFALPGGNAVNTFTILRFLPAWFPGAGFKRFANEAKKLTRQMRDVPFEFVKKGMADGTAQECIVTELLTKSDEAQSAEDTVSAIGTFFFAMAMCPEVQIKARQEIDAVIGTGRLVTYEDRDVLPYIEAIYREVMRWKPITPLGVPRCTSEEDVYNGYYIPKGHTHVLHATKILADDDIYAFGFGRRNCAGRYMASSTIWLTIATVLSTFKIEKKNDPAGHYIPLDGQYTDGLICHPPPFQCSITPRSEEATRLILEAVDKKASL
ncbi:putative CyP450 monooxygenase [Gymnopilus junonius]|uniref:CyP450 monooxygenase n=1 Tax=Gymnopilus junonius TaxID=109634 RepID=A0A9P5TR57_GYMJU|nr:putative CyP450 monooxygenase [Gymnopilus junonius]